MVDNLTDSVARARRYFEAGDFASAARSLENAAAHNPVNREPDPKSEQARAEAKLLSRAMSRDPVATCAFVLTLAVLVLLVFMYAG